LKSKNGPWDPVPELFTMDDLDGDDCPDDCDFEYSSEWEECRTCTYGYRMTNQWVDNSNIIGNIIALNEKDYVEYNNDPVCPETYCNCYKYPSNCDFKKKDCEYAANWKKEDGRIKFQVFTNNINQRWFGIGLGEQGEEPDKSVRMVVSIDEAESGGLLSAIVHRDFIFPDPLVFWETPLAPVFTTTEMLPEYKDEDNEVVSHFDESATNSSFSFSLLPEHFTTNSVSRVYFIYPNDNEGSTNLLDYNGTALMQFTQFNTRPAVGEEGFRFDKCPDNEVQPIEDIKNSHQRSLNEKDYVEYSNDPVCPENYCNCYKYPSNCNFEKKDCEYAAKWKKEDGRIKFEVFTNDINQKWYGIGLGEQGDEPDTRVRMVVNIDEHQSGALLSGIVDRDFLFPDPQVRLQEPLEPIFDTTELMAEYKDDDSSIQVNLGEKSNSTFFFSLLPETFTKNSVSRVYFIYPNENDGSTKLLGSGESAKMQFKKLLTRPGLGELGFRFDNCHNLE